MNFILVASHGGNITAWFFQTYTEAHRYMIELSKKTLEDYYYYFYNDKEIPYWEEIVACEWYSDRLFGFSSNHAYVNIDSCTYDWQIFSVHQEEHGCPLVKKVEK